MNRTRSSISEPLNNDSPTGYNQVDSYNFLNNTDTSTPMDIPHDFK